MEGQPQSGYLPDSGPPAALFEQHRQMIFRYILRQVGDPDTAEDLVQETYLRFHGGYAALKDKGALAAWLRSIASRLCIDHHRAASRQRSQVRGDDTETEPPSGEPPDDSAPPLRVVEKQAQST